MKHLHTFEEFLNENANKKITVSLRASIVKSFQKDLDANNIPYTVVRPTVFELENTPKARTAIQEAKGRFGMQSVLVMAVYEAIQTFEEFLNEGKLELNKTIPTSTKQYTWIYQTGKDSSKTAVEINKKLNGIGITSFISKTTGDTIAIPTGDIEKAFDKVISAYNNMKQFAYSDGTKINKKIVNEQTLAFESFLNEAISGKSDIIRC